MALEAQYGFQNLPRNVHFLSRDLLNWIEYNSKWVNFFP